MGLIGDIRKQVKNGLSIAMGRRQTKLVRFRKVLFGLCHVIGSETAIIVWGGRAYLLIVFLEKEDNANIVLESNDMRSWKCFQWRHVCS